MNFVLKMLATFVITYYFSVIISYAIEIWQAFPIKEETSIPIYITKELYK